MARRVRWRTWRFVWSFFHDIRYGPLILRGCHIWHCQTQTVQIQIIYSIIPISGTRPHRHTRSPPFSCKSVSAPSQLVFHSSTNVHCDNFSMEFYNWISHLVDEVHERMTYQLRLIWQLITITRCTYIWIHRKLFRKHQLTELPLLHKSARIRGDMELYKLYKYFRPVPFVFCNNKG